MPILFHKGPEQSPHKAPNSGAVTAPSRAKEKARDRSRAFSDVLSAFVADQAARALCTTSTQAWTRPWIGSNVSLEAATISSPSLVISLT